MLYGDLTLEIMSIVSLLAIPYPILAPASANAFESVLRTISLLLLFTLSIMVWSKNS